MKSPIKKKIFLCLFICIFSWNSFAQEEQLIEITQIENNIVENPSVRLNLEECVVRALRNNEDIKATHYDVYASIAKKIEATKRYVPVVKYKYRFAPVPRDIDNAASAFFSGDISVMNSIKIEAGVPVTTFGQLSIYKELADIGIDASKQKTYRKADEVILDVYKLYNGILFAREVKALALKGLEAVQNKVKELEKDENPDQLEILKLKAVLYQIEKKMDEAKSKETIALAMLKFRVGMEDDTRFNIKDSYLKRDSAIGQSYEDLLADSKAKRPEYKLLSYKVQAEEKKIKLKKSEYYPKLIAGTFFEYGISPGIRGGANETNFSNPFNFTRAAVGFELNGELDFRKLKANLEEQKAIHLMSIAEKRSNYRLLEIDFKNAYLDYELKKNLLYRSEREQRSARQIVFLTKSNLDIGVGEKKDYLDALQSYLFIQAAVYENIFNFNVAVATVKSKVGDLYQRNLLKQ